MSVAAGSLWNKNSWHWEEKDYSKWATNKLKEGFEEYSFSVDASTSFIIENVQILGFASISVRKGKKVVSFEFEINGKWRSGETNGTFTIPEFSPMELKPTVRVFLLSGDESVKESLRKKGQSLIHNRLDEFYLLLQQTESDHQKLAEDKQRRSEELAKATLAEQTMGDEKRRIAEEIKKNEAVNRSTLPSAQTGSVWNVNSYHWETRKLDALAKASLERILSNEGFTGVVVSGEAESILRKGSRKFFFDFNISSPHFSIDSFNDSDISALKIKFSQQANYGQEEEFKIKNALSQFIAEMTTSECGDDENARK